MKMNGSRSSIFSLLRAFAPLREPRVLHFRVIIDSIAAEDRAG